MRRRKGKIKVNTIESGRKNNKSTIVKYEWFPSPRDQVPIGIKLGPDISQILCQSVRALRTRSMAWNDISPVADDLRLKSGQALPEPTTLFHGMDFGIA